ncbi:MAG: UDP-diphospho-muramoylpentapeptide beta-N-acetylglucosaminyltransferase [Anaerolineaceae bacterium]|nr:MAG: UDP-diphospho-muramoylpentapeptide beta-N-acetylglucosaminyltransferase [Anaerolineaceae bacterium]
MNIYILTGKFGLGHFTAALAIKQYIDSSDLDANVEIIDWLGYIFPKISEKYYHFFSLLVTKGNKVYNRRYLLLENKQTDQKPELCLYFLRCFKKFVSEKRPDLIISTLPICSQIVSTYKERTGSQIPLLTCITDITGHSEWISKKTDFYFVGSHTVKNILMSKNVPAYKIHITGIPVRMEFVKGSRLTTEASDKSNIRILVMGGGLGIFTVDDEFYNGLNMFRGADVTIITGNNIKLYKNLYGRYTNVQVLGYVSNVYDYMREADVLITKPGGITTFEAINCEVPILALKPYLQQEIYNAKFIRDMNIGTIINGSSQECLDHMTRILNCDCIEMYRSNIKKLKSDLSVNKIIQVLNESIIPFVHTVNTYEYKSISAKIDGDMNDEKISFNF